SMTIGAVRRRVRAMPTNENTRPTTRNMPPYDSEDHDLVPVPNRCACKEREGLGPPSECPAHGWRASSITLPRTPQNASPDQASFKGPAISCGLAVCRTPQFAAACGAVSTFWSNSAQKYESPPRGGPRIRRKAGETL